MDRDDRCWLVANHDKGVNIPEWQLEPAVLSTKPIYDVNASAYFTRSNHSTDKETAALWHQRLGHVGMQALHMLVKNDLITGVNIPHFRFAPTKHHTCQVCVMAKHNKAPHKVITARAPHAGHTYHSDIAGPYPVRTLGGGKYVLTLYDEYSTVCAVSILKDLKHAGDELRRMILAWKAIHGLLPKVIHSDRGGCYIDGPMKEWCLEHGISQNFSSPRTPQQNGKAERLNQTLNDIMRSLLFQYGTHLPLWGHAMTYASLIYNVALCKRLGMTRYEAFIGVKPDVSNFRTFGCKVFARVDDTERTKLDPKSQVGIYLGPQLDGPGYKVLVYDPELKARHKYAVHIVRDMVTYEDLTVVTGAQDVSQLHWGGEIPLPTPLLEAHEPQPLEQLTGEPLPIALTEGAPMAYQRREGLS
jgi:Transposase and inactivated derivatives